MDNITARLELWYKEPTVADMVIIFGRIFDDSEGRFNDGDYIYTSDFKDRELKEGDVVQTRNSRYLLGKPMKKVLEETE